MWTCNVALPPDIEALLKTMDFWGKRLIALNEHPAGVVMEQAAAALRATLYDLDRLKDELRVESAAKAAHHGFHLLLLRAEQAERERDAAMDRIREMEQ